VEIIKQQINLACEGVAYRVSELQTETGVKDQTAQHWIDRALERSSELKWKQLHEPMTKDPHLSENLRPDERKQVKKMICSEITAEVHHWVIEQPPERYAQLPQDSRKMFILFVLGILTKIHPKQFSAMNSALETTTTSYLGSQACPVLSGVWPLGDTD
jgi:hypothetical protein